jgi:hypothetical protein
MRYEGWVWCNTATGQAGAASVDGWAKVPGNSIKPRVPSECVSGIEWHGAVGWVGHMVGLFDYVESPTNAEASPRSRR